MKWWILIILLVVLLVYIVVGGLIFMTIESGNEEDTIYATGQFRSDFLANKTCVSSDEFDTLVQTLYTAYDQGIKSQNDSSEIERTWTAHTSIYFATTVVTTIGYGNISPATTGGRVFCIFFALVGIPLCLVVLAEIGNKITKVTKKLDKWIQDRTAFCAKRPKLMKIIRFAIVHILGLILFVFIPAAIFDAMEEGWTYGDGVYYSFITLTTIGFGDYVAGFNDVWRHPMYRIMVAGWIIIGLAWMSTVVASTQELLDNKVTDIIEKNTKKDPEKEDNETVSDKEKEANGTGDIIMKTEL